MDIYHIWCNLKPRAGEVEAFHFGVNSLVTDARFALYRDFPDKGRETGGEMF